MHLHRHKATSALPHISSSIAPFPEIPAESRWLQVGKTKLVIFSRLFEWILVGLSFAGSCLFSTLAIEKCQKNRHPWKSLHKSSVSRLPYQSGTKNLPDMEIVRYFIMNSCAKLRFRHLETFFRTAYFWNDQPFFKRIEKVKLVISENFGYEPEDPPDCCIVWVCAINFMVILAYFLDVQNLLFHYQLAIPIFSLAIPRKQTRQQ